MFDDRHSHSLAPDTELVYCCCTECVGSSQINLLSRLLKLPGEFSDSCGLTHTIYANDQYDVWLMVAGQIPIVIILCIILCQELGNLILKYSVELRGGHILIASHTLFDSLDDLQSGVHTDITRYQHLFQVVENIVINL